MGYLPGVLGRKLFSEMLVLQAKGNRGDPHVEGLADTELRGKSNQILEFLIM